MGTTITRDSPVPMYMQIYESVRGRIKSGELKVGDRVESERQLAARFHVSLMTARQALQELEEEGLVKRRHGAGSFVRAPRINWNRLMSFTEQMAMRGISSRSTLVGAQVVRADDEIALHLQLASHSPVIRLERLRFGNDEPLALENCHLSFRDFPTLLNYPLERTSLFTIIENDFHVRISHAEEIIEAQNATKGVAKLLGIPPGHPLLHLKQTLFATGNRPICYSTCWYRSDRHFFKVVRPRPVAEGV